MTKKATIDPTATVTDQLLAIKENVEVVTGRRGGKIALTKGISTPSVGVDVAAAGPAQVTLKSEFDQLILMVRDLEAKYNALVNRLNTP